MPLPRTRLALATLAGLLVACSDTVTAPEPTASPALDVVAGAAIATTSTTQMIAAEQHVSFSSADVDGARVVYRSNANNGDIILMDLDTREKRVIADGSAAVEWPRISGNRIVWADRRNGNWDIYMYDLSTSTETRLTSNPYDQLQPNISGRWVVWADRRDTPTTTKIWALNLDAPGSERALAVAGEEGWNPFIDGDWVTYSSRSAGYSSLGDTKAYDLRTNVEVHVMSGKPLSARFPAGISGTKVLYNVFDDQTGASRAWVYDIIGGTHTQVSAPGATAQPVAIEGNDVYWLAPSCCNQVVLVKHDLASAAESTIGDRAFYSGVAASGERAVWTSSGAVWYHGPPLPNATPVVSLGGSSSAAEGQGVTFNTSGTVDPDGDALTFLWNFGDGSAPQSGPASTHASLTHVFADDGSYTVTLTATDARGASATRTHVVTVSNAQPSATFVSPSSAIPGATFPLSLTGATDPGSADVAAGFTWAFDCGDGSWVAASGPAATCTAPNAQGTRTVGGRITDNDGGSRTYTASVSLSNVTPTAVLQAPSLATEGTSITVALAEPIDTPGDLAGLEYQFDCGSGTYAAASSASSRTCLLDDSGTRTVRGKVIDAHGAFSDYSAPVSVANVAPTATMQAPASVDMDASFTVSLVGGADASSADMAAGLTFQFDCGDGAFSAASRNASATCDAGAGRALLVKARVSDKDGGMTEYAAEVAVRNVAPTARLTVPASVTEGSAIAVRLADAMDTPSHVGALSYAFDCGSGYGAASATPSTTCATTDDGARTVRAKVIDRDGAFTEYAASVTVVNAVPVVTVNGHASIVSGDALALSASFTDAGANDGPWSVTIEWGDGTSSSLAGTAGMPIQATHRYVATGNAVIRMTVTDKDGGAGRATHALVVTRKPVAIDVLPGSSENPFRLNERGNGALPVAILGSATFDVRGMDVESIRIVGTAGSVGVSTRGNGQQKASREDVNGDGYADLMLHFDRAALLDARAVSATSARITLHATAEGGVQVVGIDGVRVMTK